MREKTVKVLRGLRSNLGTTLTLLQGELGYTTDTNEVYVGDGSGGHHLIGKATIGTEAGRPAAGVAGRIYQATDTNRIFVDTGTAWIDPVLAIISDTATATDKTWSSVKIRSEIDLAAATLGTQAEWQESALDRLAAPPGTPTAGDRYLIIATATGVWAGKENQIAEWDGTAWGYVIPTVGTYISVDAETDGIYYFGGSTWTKKFYEATTASTGLLKDGVDIQIDPDAAGDGLAFSAGVLSADIDGVSIKYDAANGNRLYVDTIDCGTF